MGAATASIEHALGSSDAEERRQATTELGGMPIDAALPMLLRALGDEDWRVRKEATIAARAFRTATSLCEALIRAIGESDNVGLRNAAVDVLASSGCAATAALGAALPRLDADGRKLAIEALGKGKDPAAIDALVGALRDADDNVRQGAIEAISALGAIARERVAGILVARLDDRDRVVRLTALEGLTALDVPVPWERLAPLLEDPTLSATAIAAAAISTSAEAPQALAHLLGVAHVDAGTKAFDHALRALGRLAEGPLAGEVTTALATLDEPTLGKLVLAAAPDARGEESATRRATALRLAALARAPGALDAAIAALAEDALAEDAQRALAALGAPLLPDMIARLDDPKIGTEGRSALVDAIGGAAAGATTSEVLDALRRAARDPDRRVAVRALVALSRLGGEADLEIVAALTLEDARPLAAAAEAALAALAARSPAAAFALADRLSESERSLLPAAIAIGAAAGSSPFEDRHATFLAHAATSGDARARRAAVRAVAEARAAAGASFPGAMEILRIALADEERDVQIAAARALGRLCTAKDAPRASSVLDLVDRSAQGDLVAATVRAIGEGFVDAIAVDPARAADLVPALGLFARGAPSAVAIAAIEALGQARRAGLPAASNALAAALDHPDESVAKAALLKLSAVPEEAPRLEAFRRALSHGKPAVRALAAELLADRPEGS